MMFKILYLFFVRRSKVQYINTYIITVEYAVLTRTHNWWLDITNPPFRLDSKFKASIVQKREERRISAL